MKSMRGVPTDNKGISRRDVLATCERLEQAGVPIVLRPGPMTHAPDETAHREVIAFIEDPDGYKIELIEA